MARPPPRGAPRPTLLFLTATLFSTLFLARRCTAIGVETSVTGHTGGIGHWATTTTIPGFSLVEGAMIPRFCQVKNIIQVHTTEDVQAAIREATAKCAGRKLSIRATRQLYSSSSDILCPDTSAGDCSYVLDMEPFNKVISLDAKSQTLTGGATLIFARALDFLEDRGWTMEFGNLPFYSNLSLAGMLMAGSHGSSTQHPSAFGNIVRSFTWVDAMGEVHTSHEPARFIGTLGLFGIITEVTVEITPKYKLQAYPYRTHDYDLIERMPGYLQDPDISLVQWLPDVKQAIIMKRKKVPDGTKGWAEFNPLQNNPLISPLGALTVEVQQIDNALTGNAQGLLPDLPICLAATVLLPYFRGHYTKIPFPFGVPVVGETKHVCCTDCEPGPDFGCLWRTTAVNLYELDMDWKILLDWMRDVRKIIRNEVRAEKQGPCLPSVIEFAMRFGRASDWPMDMAYHQDTAYVDVVSVKGPHTADAPASHQHVFDELEQLTLCKYKGRVHWGKNQNRAFTNPNCPLRDRYPKMPEVLNEAKQYDPHGIFVTPVIAQMLGREPIKKTPGCASRSECYCTEDIDCGYHHKCVPAETFPEYLVCKAPKEVLKDNIFEGLKG